MDKIIKQRAREGEREGETHREVQDNSNVLDFVGSNFDDTQK